MPELPTIPDPGWSSIEKAFYCRAQAINLLEEAERADSSEQAEELAGVALRWLALARFHEAESVRPQVVEAQTANREAEPRRAQWNPAMSSRRRNRNIVED